MADALAGLLRVLTPRRAKCFLTEYPGPRSKATFGSFVWARDHEHANALAKQRGLGERVISVGYDHPVADNPAPSQLLAERSDWAKAPASAKLELIHATIFLAYLAVASGVRSKEDMLSDEGLLHDLVHFLQYQDDPNTLGLANLSRNNMLRWVKDVESETPGYRPF